MSSFGVHGKLICPSGSDCRKGWVGRVNKPKWPADRLLAAPVGKAPDWELNNV